MRRIGVANAGSSHDHVEKIYQRVRIRNEISSVLVCENLVTVSPDVVDAALLDVNLDLSPNFLRRIVSQRTQSNFAEIAADTTPTHYFQKPFDCRVYNFGNVFKFRKLF